MRLVVAAIHNAAGEEIFSITERMQQIADAKPQGGDQLIFRTLASTIPQNYLRAD